MAACLGFRKRVVLECVKCSLFAGHSWPSKVVPGNVPVHKMWADMEELVTSGLARSIGISNWPVLLIHDLLNYAKVAPSCHQIEIHPYFQQKENADYCISRGIQVTAYSSLGNAKEAGPLSDKTVLAIAATHKVSAAQILLRWGVQHGYSVIPKSTTPARIAENFALDFTLEPSEMASLDGLERGMRTCDWEVFWQWPYYH